MNFESDALKGQLVLGIDLGTTNSGVSVWRAEEGKVAMLADVDGYNLTPSLVGWDCTQKEWAIGRDAATLNQQSPGTVAYSIKRYIGRRFTDPNVLYGRQDVNYQLISGGGTEQLRDVVVDFGTDSGVPVRLSAPEVSAKVLFKLRQDAARVLNVSLEAIANAVITVPAYFNHLQRKATILAGELAGLKVIEILNEPTAAALAYSDAIPFGCEDRKILVYDLGGGTFDISLLEVSRDEVGYVVHTRAIDGDTRLGGDDIDISVVRWLTERIEQQYGYSVRLDDYKNRERLRQAVEQAKIALSEREVVAIDLSELDLGSRDRQNDRIELTRVQLEACADEVLRKTLAIAQRAVEDLAGLTWEQIDEVILVGGQTLMPAIQRAVESLTGRKPRVNDRPQLAVALGAGEYARILSLGKDKLHENAVINCLALPLGIRLNENTFEVLVPANVILPHKSHRPFIATTTEDNQTSIRVEVLQGFPGVAKADDCRVLGNINMEVPPAPKGIPKFEIVFDVRSDATLSVIVSDRFRKRDETLDI